MQNLATNSATNVKHLCNMIQILKKYSLNLNCEYCTKWSNYSKKARICRDEYQKDFEKYNTENGVRYSADLQKIMMLPYLDGFYSALFF